MNLFIVLIFFFSSSLSFANSTNDSNSIEPEQTCTKTLDKWTLPFPWIKYIESKSSPFKLPLPPRVCLGKQIKIYDENSLEVGTLDLAAQKSVFFSAIYVELAKRHKNELNDFLEEVGKDVKLHSPFDFTRWFLLSQIDPDTYYDESIHGKFNTINLATVSFTKNSSYELKWNRYTHQSKIGKIQYVDFRGVVETLKSSPIIVDTTGQNLKDFKNWRIPGAQSFSRVTPMFWPGALSIDDLISHCFQMELLIRNSQSESEKKDKKRILIYDKMKNSISLYQAYFCIPLNEKSRVVAIENLAATWDDKHPLPDYKRLESRMITFDQFLTRRQAPNTVVIYARSIRDFNREHIAGSTHTEYRDSRVGHFVAYNMARFNKSQKIILYGINDHDLAGMETLASLVRRGFDVTYFEGGLEEWVHKGRPLEGSLHQNSKPTTPPAE